MGLLSSCNIGSHGVHVRSRALVYRGWPAQTIFPQSVPSNKTAGSIPCSLLGRGISARIIVWCISTHHEHSDTDRDPYRVEHGFWWAHVGWIWRIEADVDRALVKDLHRNKLVGLARRFSPSARDTHELCSAGVYCWGAMERSLRREYVEFRGEAFVQPCHPLRKATGRVNRYDRRPISTARTVSPGGVNRKYPSCVL